MALATEAAWCAQDQGGFFDYQHALFENQGMTFNQNTLIDLAVTLGLNRDTFAQCLSNGEHQDDVEKARRAAISKGINSTPTFLINKQRVRSNRPYEEFQKIIDQELAIAQ